MSSVEPVATVTASPSVNAAPLICSKHLAPGDDTDHQRSEMGRPTVGVTQTIAQIVDRMKELATLASSDNVDDAGRGRIKSEYDELDTEITKIAATTKFQGKTLIDGNFGTSLDTNSANSTAFASGKGVYSATLSGAAAGNYTIADGTANGVVTLTFGSTTQTITGVSAGKQSLNFSQFGVTVETGTDFTVKAGTVAG